MAKAISKSKSKSKSKAKSKPRSITIAAIKRAVEGRNAHAIVGLYADDAVVQVIDRDNPPSNPHSLEGKTAISAYFNDVCGRNMTHKLESGISEGKRIAFTQSCTYPNGNKVYCSATIELKSGKIARQIVVQAWDI